ncbi:hypothetical protein O181_019712 [Austropuccinia psidii MF-1]|uniref:Reverse transcriptase Ty1/copia-type domain-containing protein n=1 Tax=Austropuccinia psidii MF-1 TaxID=1389203 RepID=A0A9Q3GUP2_9BASI|nr:hypothetical protein [Austropuccinia psidii MF-1]
MNIPASSVLKVKKALYGTKKEACCWWLHLKMILHQLRLNLNGEDPSTYFLDSPKGKAMLWSHVDNGALNGSSTDVLDFILTELNKCMQIKWDSDITGLVGLEITRNSNTFQFTQTQLIEKLCGISPSNITSSSPLTLKFNLHSNPSKVMNKDYLKRIGMLLYIAQGTRPDISYEVNYLARYLMGPDSSHWKAMEHLIGYLRKTRTVRISISNYEGSPGLECYVDANWGGEGNRSMHGFLLLR